MADHRIGISLDVRQGQAVDRLQRDFRGVADSAQKIAERFKELDRQSRTMTARGWGSEQYTRQLREQLSVVERLARLTERQARIAGNPAVQSQMAGVRADIRQSYGDIGAVRGASSPAMSDIVKNIAQTLGMGIASYAGIRGLRGIYTGYNANLQQLPAVANMAKTMAPGGGDMSWMQNMLKSGQGYGYTNPEILGGAQSIQGAAGNTKDFFNQIKGVAQFGRANGFDYQQASNYFSNSYKAGITGGSAGQMNWQQYAILVANTVNAGNMQGKNAQVVEALQSFTSIAQQNMMNAPNQSMIGSLYATATKGGNQSLINQLPQLMQSIDSGISSPGMGAMGKAAMYQAVAPGADYFHAKYLTSQGAFGVGDNGKSNFQNMMQFAYNHFGGNSEKAAVMMSDWLPGLKPDKAKALMSQYMINGTFDEGSYNLNKGSLQSQLSSLDQIQQNTANVPQRQQEMTSGVVGAGQSLNNAVYGNTLGNVVTGGVGLYTGGKILKSILNAGKGIAGRVAGGAATAAAGGAVAEGAGITAGEVLAGGAAMAGGEAATGIGIPVAIATIGGALLTAGGIWAYNKFKKSKTQTPSSTISSSADLGSSSQVSSDNFDASKAATETAAILMALRPWANQIQGWYSGSGGVGSPTPSSSTYSATSQAGANPATLIGSKGATWVSMSKSKSGGSYGGSAPNGVPTAFWNAAVSAGNATGVDPILLAAIGQNETHWGTDANSYPGFSMGYGDLGPGPNNKKWEYQDKPGEFTNQTMSAAKQIASYMKGRPITADSLRDFMNNSWQPGDKKWADKVYGEYQALGGTGGGGANISIKAPNSINIQLTDSDGNVRGSGLLPLTTTASYNGLVNS